MVRESERRRASWVVNATRFRARPWASDAAVCRRLRGARTTGGNGWPPRGRAGRPSGSRVGHLANRPMSQGHRPGRVWVRGAHLRSSPPALRWIASSDDSSDGWPGHRDAHPSRRGKQAAPARPRSNERPLERCGLTGEGGQDVEIDAWMGSNVMPRPRRKAPAEHPTIHRSHSSATKTARRRARRALDRIRPTRHHPSTIRQRFASAMPPPRWDARPRGGVLFSPFIHGFAPSTSSLRVFQPSTDALTPPSKSPRNATTGGGGRASHAHPIPPSEHP